MPTSKQKPGHKLQWLTNYCSLGGGRTIREQAAPAPATTIPAPAAPVPAAPVDPRQTIFDSYTDKICDLLDDEDAPPQATADEIAKWLKKRASALADYDAATGSESVMSKPAKKFPKRMKLPPDHDGLPHLKGSLGPETDDPGLEAFLGKLRGLNTGATSGVLEDLRIVRQGEEYLTEDTYGYAPRTADDFLAGVRVVRE